MVVYSVNTQLILYSVTIHHHTIGSVFCQQTTGFFLNSIYTNDCEFSIHIIASILTMILYSVP